MTTQSALARAPARQTQPAKRRAARCGGAAAYWQGAPAVERPAPIGARLSLTLSRGGCYGPRALPTGITHRRAESFAGAGDWRSAIPLASGAAHRAGLRLPDRRRVPGVR